jgi:hypothetical protein
MSKIELSPLPSGFQTTTALNQRLQLIEDALNNDVLYRENPEGEPNSMNNELDMDSNPIINVPAAEEDHHPVILGQIEAVVSEAVANLDLSLGNVVGPLSSVNDDVVLFDGVTGRLLKGSNGRVPKVIDTYASLATTPLSVGQVVITKGHTLPGIGSLPFIGKSGSTTNNRGTLSNTATAGVYAEAILNGFVTPQMFGALANGTNNDCDPFRYAIAASKSIFLPEGTYLIEPTADSGDFMLYLGTANGNSDRSGMKIWGTGRKSIIKLGNSVGANKLLFGGASTDVMSNMQFSDFAIDLNAANNLQVNFGDPLRYNSAFYMYCKCSNFLFENLYIHDISGHQAIRIGAEDANKYGDNIRIINCDFENFGIAISGNNQQDVSVCYIQADRITVEGGSFKNPNFTFDLARGHTALELHGDSSTKVSGVNFAYVQLPELTVSSYKSNRNTIIEKCVFNECNYFVSLDGGELDQTSIKVTDCEYQSTKCNSVIFPIGNSAETAKSRDRIEFLNNTVNCSGNTNQDNHLFVIEDNYIKSLIIKGNTVKSLNGCLLYSAGTIRNSDVLTIDICDNHLDSLGSASGSFPNDPAFVYLAHSSGGINTINIKNNQLYNSDAKNYSAVGCYRITGRVLNTVIDGTTGNVSTTYPLTTESSVTGVVTKVIESNGLAMPIKHRSGLVALAGSSSVNLYDFTAFGNNDNSMLEIKIFANVGGTANGTVQSWDVLYSSNGKVIEKETGGGTYNADVILELSGTVLRVRSTTGTDLTFNYVVTGDSTKNIVWLV